MSGESHIRKAFPILLVFAGLVFSIANVLVLLVTVKGSITVPLAVELYRICAPCVVYFALAPLVVAFLHVLLFRQAAGSAAPAPVQIAPESRGAPEPGPVAEADPSASALKLLELLQREGRFLDFLAEDLNAYSDAQIGAAVRAIHAGCRKALEGRLELERILPGEEGQEVTVPSGFDANEIRLTGDVRGAGPYHGTLQHPGWRVRKLVLPSGSEATPPRVLAPAEVEIVAPASPAHA
jgi:hypothetical protein